MSYLNIQDVTSYTPPENTALVYSVEGNYKFKTTEGVVGDVPANALPLLGIEVSDVPCLVFTEDLNATLAKTVISTANVTVAMSSKATMGYVQEIAKRKVDKTDFLSALSRTGEAIDELQANVGQNASDIATVAANVTAAKEELAGDISGVEDRVTANETDIAAIKVELNGGVEGGEGGPSVSERLAALEDATAVETTDEAPIVVPVDRDGDGENEASKLNDAYAPVLKFNGTYLGVLNNEINVIGDGSVSVVDGKVTLRLGPNLNSSAFHTTDGVTTGTATATGIPTAKKVLADGTSTKVVWLTGGEIKITTAGAIHFDNDTSTTFELTVGDQTFTFGPITGNNTYGDDTTKAKLVVANFAKEAKAGSTGYAGKVTFTVNINKLGLADGDFKVTLKHIGSSGAATFTSASFYLVNDTTTKASVSNATVELVSTSAKTISGVSYLTKGTVNVKADISNAFTPASSGTNGSTISYAINGWASNPAADTLTYTENGKSSATSSTLTNGEYAADATTVKITPTNINGNGTATTASLGKALLIDNTAQGTGSDLSEPFESETRRLTEDLKPWDNTWSLADGAAGAEGLMIKSGALIYPVGKYTGYNDGYKDIVGANQPDYSACTGERSYIRKFGKANSSYAAADLTFSHNKSIQSFCTANTLKLEVSSDGSNWIDVTRLASAGGCGTGFTFAATTTKISFKYPGGFNSYMYVRIAMASSSVDVQISNLEVSNLA